MGSPAGDAARACEAGAACVRRGQEATKITLILDDALVDVAGGSALYELEVRAPLL